MYEKRFLWGVEGVRLAGNDNPVPAVGGVRDLEGSKIVVEWFEPGASGDNAGGVGWANAVSKSSFRSTFEYVRLASSAANC
jgi:hypothetical protein